MNMYNKAIGGYEVYTYFGRVVWREWIKEDETHHVAQENARRMCERYEKLEGKSYWVRRIK